MIIDMQNTSHVLKVAGNHFNVCVTFISIFIFTLIPEKKRKKKQVNCFVNFNNGLKYSW